MYKVGNVCISEELNWKEDLANKIIYKFVFVLQL